jgi:WD40 repeat protein
MNLREKYNAFISYSHAADGKLAPAIQAGLENFAKPWFKIRNLNIFRDESNLTISPNLWGKIQQALDNSNYLIYMASPESAKSKWVIQEISYWLENKSLDTILIVLTDGELKWRNNGLTPFNERNSLPEILEEKVLEEPLFGDFTNLRKHDDLSLNNPLFKNEVLKIASQLHNKEPKELASEEVRTHKRMVRVRNIALIALVTLFLTATGAAFVAYINANKARIERDIAQANYLMSEAKDQFDISPSLALKLAEIALNKNTDSSIERSAYEIAIKTTYPQIILNEKAPLTSTIFSPDGSFILTGSEDGVPKLWSLDGAPVKEFKKNITGVSSLAFSKDGQNILYSSSNQFAFLSSINGSFVKKIHKSGYTISSVAFSPVEKYIATGSWDSCVQLWDWGGNEIKELKGPKKAIRSVVFSPKGEYILAGSWDGKAYLWDLTGKLIRIFEGHEKEISEVVFSPNGNFILTGSYDKTAFLWDLGGNIIQRFIGHRDFVSSVAFSPDGNTILTGSWDRTAILWNLKGQIIRQFKYHSAEISSVAFSPNGKYIITGSWDKTACVWNLTSNMIKEYKGHTDQIRSMVLSADGKYLATCSWDETICLWYINDDTVKRIKKIKKDLQYIKKLAFSADQKSIVIAFSNSVIAWHIIQDTIQELEGDNLDLKIFSLPKNDWDLLRSEIMKAKAVASSSDSKRFIFTTRDTAFLQDLDENVIQEFVGHNKEVTSAAFSFDGKFILTGSKDNTARLWDLKGNFIQEFKGHMDIITSVALSPNGKFILTGSEDNTARLWDLKGNPIQEFRGHSDCITSVLFSKDGTRIITGSDDKTIRVWEVSPINLKSMFKKNILSEIDKRTLKKYKIN